MRSVADTTGFASGLDAVDAAFLRRGTCRTERQHSGFDAPGDDRSLLEWLLAAAPDQWNGLADRVERAAGDGHRVIAVVGGDRGEGRTTIVHGLVATLASRGLRVHQASHPCGSDGREPAARDLVIVDAGIWFPPGRFRRDRLSAVSMGCDAVILVRRAATPPSAARAAAIRQAGLAFLGEVETFAGRSEAA